MNPPNYSRRAPAALILSSDALGAALLGAALELLGYRASFPRADERGSDALRRIRPRVVLVDAGEDFLSDGGVLGPALMTGAQLVLFGTPERVRDIRVLAAKYNATPIALPEDVGKLADILWRAPRAEPTTDR